MGFFSGVRRRIKKLIPKEIRPFVPYAAAFLPGGMGLSGNLLKFGGDKFLKAALARGLTDDEASIKDIARTGILSAAPTAIGEGLQLGSVNAELAGKMKTADYLGRGADYVKDMSALKTIGGQGAIDYGIKAAELNEDALDEYNRMMAERGITDRKDRRAAIRAIYEGTGTWDMDEVDSMLDTYGYRTGGRVGYAMGDRVDTDQIIEDFQRIPSIGQGIGNLARVGADNIDLIIESLMKLTPFGGIRDIVEILVERYGVDPEVAQRKVINRMSDANRGFGPQGPQGTPDDGYNPNIGIDAGAEDYYGETPAMPENLGDMGGNMDDMSGNSILNRLRRGEEIMPRPDRMPDLNVPRDMPDMRQMPLPLDYEPKFDRMPLPLDYERKYTPMENGGETERERRKRKREEFDEGFEYAKEGLDSLEALEDKYKPMPIRELRLADGGRVSELKEAYQRYLEMARKDGSKKIIPFEIFAEEFARENFARGGITDIEVEEGYDDGYGPDVPGMFEEIQTTTEEDTSDMMASNPEVMDSLNELSLMLYRRPLSDLTDDEYEELQDFASQQSLKPGLIDEYRNYKYNAEEQGQTPMSPRDYFRMEFGAARIGVKKGGPIELNINVGGNNMEDIKGQTAGPDYYIKRIEDLLYNFPELSEEEAEDIAYDSEKYYDKIGYEPGDYKKGGKVIELMPKGILYKGKAKDYPGIKQLIKDMKKKGTRPKKAEGGLMSMGGNEMDLRGGGFVPMGAKERADDVPARLSKNEFVMTADAVRGAGGGSVQKGADLMYDQMKRLEGQA